MIPAFAFSSTRLTCSLLLSGLLVSIAQPSQADTRLASQRPALLTALHAAERGHFTRQEAARVADHPLLPWLEAIALQHNLQRVHAKQVRKVLRQYGAQPASDWLRTAWLGELARRQDWAGFREFYAGGGSTELRCADLTARHDAGNIDATWVSDARSLWLSPQSLPTRCDPVFRTLESQGQLDDGLRWQRIELAAAHGQFGLMRFLAGRLPPNEAGLARDYADFIETPHARAAQWPRTSRSQSIAAEGLRRLARRTPDGAEALLAAIAGPLGLSETLRASVHYEIALWTVASYLPDSAARLDAVPADAYDERLHEWRVREAMSRNDDARALRSIEAMSERQRNDPRWQYFEARLRERLGQTQAAKPLYAAAANTATFHGFLAADRLQQPYTLCPLEPSADKALRQRIAALPGLQRAVELFTIDRPGLAEREWAALMKTLSAEERHVAIELAKKAHWYDRAVFHIGSTPEDLRQYRLRFPLHHERTLRREAHRHALDAAWVAAQTRAESAFMPMARSHADARGLMQLLPGTAAMTARRLGVTWAGPASLYRPNTNLELGIAHLRHELDKHNGLPYLAIAAYNAGPTPVARWQQARAHFDTDFWIETVTYKETRDYVARVMAFSVIYDWQMEGSAIPVSERLVGRTVPSSARRAFQCPNPSLMASRSSTP